jgi:hypothetical protein
MNTKLFENLLDVAKKDRKKLKQLYDLVIHCQQYEFAAEIRDLEKDLFPITPEEESAKINGARIRCAFNMAGYNVDTPTAWLFNEISVMVRKKKGSYTLKDSSILVEKMKELFHLD